MTRSNWELRLSPLADQDILDVLQFTNDRFGEQQADDYADLIGRALTTLEDDPLDLLSKPRDDVRAGLRCLHIGQRGRNARHLFVYRVHEDAKIVEVLRLLHDAMDLERHLPETQTLARPSRDRGQRPAWLQGRR